MPEVVRSSIRKGSSHTFSLFPFFIRPFLNFVLVREVLFSIMHVISPLQSFCAFALFKYSYGLTRNIMPFSQTQNSMKFNIDPNTHCTQDPFWLSNASDESQDTDFLPNSDERRMGKIGAARHGDRIRVT